MPQNDEITKLQGEIDALATAGDALAKKIGAEEPEIEAWFVQYSKLMKKIQGHPAEKHVSIIQLGIVSSQVSQGQAAWKESTASKAASTQESAAETADTSASDLPSEYPPSSGDEGRGSSKNDEHDPIFPFSSPRIG